MECILLDTYVACRLKRISRQSILYVCSSTRIYGVSAHIGIFGVSICITTGYVSQPSQPFINLHDGIWN